MSDIKVAFRAALIGDAGVSALLADRLYDVGLGLQGRTVYPSATYQRITSTPVYTMDQANDRWGKNGWVRFQLMLLDTDPERLMALMLAFKAALKTFNLAQEPGDNFSQAPNFVLREGPGSRIAATTPPVFTDVLDVRCYYRED